jgi:hypothetical protein
MLYLTPYILVLLGVASASTGQVEVPPPSGRGLSLGRVTVAVLAMPSSLDTIKTTPETRLLAERVATALRSADFQVVVAGVVHDVSLEELIARASTGRADVALGVWNVEASTRCPAVLAPELVSPPEPESFKVQGDEARLARYMKEVTASSRSEASARLAAALSSAGTWCNRKPSEAETYVLEGTRVPAIIMSVATRDEARLTERIPSVIEEWLAAERRNGRTTRE